MAGIIPAYAANYTMMLQTDRASYSGTQPITITGVVSPALGPNTAVVVAVKNPSGIVAGIEDDLVNATTGAFSQVTVPGGSANWIAGTYTVNATAQTRGRDFSLLTGPLPDPLL